MRRPNCRLVILAAAALAVGGCFKERVGWGYTGHDSARFGGQRVYSPRVDLPPEMDGSRSDAAWRMAPAVEVAAQGPEPGLKGVFNPRFTVQSVHTESRVYFVVSWRDLSDRANGKKRLVNFLAPPKAFPDQAVALGFPLSGEPPRLTGTWDLWQWSAHGLDEGGFGTDLTCTFSETATGAEAYELPLAAGSIRVACLPDAETSLRAPPDPAADACEPELEVIPHGDVDACGAWSCGRWMVEFSRPLRTGDPVDVAIESSRPIPLALVWFDRDGRIRRVSHDLWLVVEEDSHRLDPRGGR